MHAPLALWMHPVAQILPPGRVRCASKALIHLRAGTLCSTGASRQAAPGQTILQTGARSRMGLNRAWGQSSRFQKPPKQQSCLQKQYCFTSTAVCPSQALQMDFQRYFSPPRYKVKSGGVLKGSSLGNPGICIHQAPQLLWHSECCSGRDIPRFPRQILFRSSSLEEAEVLLHRTAHVSLADPSSLAFRKYKMFQVLC